MAVRSVHQFRKKTPAEVSVTLGKKRRGPAGLLARERHLHLDPAIEIRGGAPAWIVPPGYA